MTAYAYDIENFGGYFCMVACNDDGMHTFGPNQLWAIRDFVKEEPTIVGYNNFGYDDLLLKRIVADENVTVEQLNALGNRIIGSNRLPEDLFKLQYANYPWNYSIDMFQVLNKKGSLKEWECKIHYQTVRDSPVDFTKPLDPKDQPATLQYCQNDTRATWELYKRNKHLIELRKQLADEYDVGNRVYVLGDAGLTKMIAMKHYKDRTGGWSTTARKAAESSDENTTRLWATTDIVSPRVHFTTPEFQDFYATFRQQAVSGDTLGTRWGYEHDFYDTPVQLGACSYQIGVGGLHSCDTPGRFFGTPDVGIFDLDVASYYPSLIINEQLYPRHIGPHSLADYTRIRDARLAAKHAGDKQKANMYKLLLNSYFGVLNEAHSPIRSIISALRVTINGQLQLLMLIERLERIGCRVLSANTDGVTFLFNRSRMHEVEREQQGWEGETGHNLERNEYARYCRRDVNNYCALYTDGGVKTKGAFEQDPIGGKTDERIVKQAAQDWLLKHAPIAETVRNSHDIRDFIYYQRCKNGGTLHYAGRDIGRTARWYVGRSDAGVCRKNPDGTFDSLPNGRHAQLIMDLPASMPADVNYDYYIGEAVNLVNSITSRKKAKKTK